MNYRDLVELHGKRCPVCTRKKPADDFGKNRSRYDGRQAYCRACTKERFGESKRAYETSEKGRARKSRWRARNPDASARYSRMHKENRRLRASMAEGDKIYRYDRPASGSALGLL